MDLAIDFTDSSYLVVRTGNIVDWCKGPVENRGRPDRGSSKIRNRFCDCPWFRSVSLVFTMIIGLMTGCNKPLPTPANQGAVHLPNQQLGSGRSKPNPSGHAKVTLTGFVGGEKSEFLQNPKFQEILADDYGLVIDWTKAGSIEMVKTMDLSGKDFIWPSNDFAVALMRSKGAKFRKEQIVFNSPIVIYTGWNIANALIKEGIVEKRAEGYFIVRFSKLIEMVTTQKTWKEIGLIFHGKVTIRSTDPIHSNSGCMFAGLVSSALNKGEVIDDETVAQVLPEMKQFFSRLGLMEHSSGDIFRKFIATGTNNSMVVGYENQIIEFIIANAESREQIENSVCVLYPDPTTWSSHPVVSLTDRGDRLIQALMDERIQKLAWSDHGFRSGLEGVNVDPTTISLHFIPESIDSVIPLPGVRPFERLLDGLEAK
jgi:hypothetical protein